MGKINVELLGNLYTEGQNASLQNGSDQGD